MIIHPINIKRYHASVDASAWKKEMSRYEHNGIILPKYNDKNIDFTLRFVYNKDEIIPAIHALTIKVPMMIGELNQLAPDIKSHIRQQTIPVEMLHSKDAMNIFLNI